VKKAKVAFIVILVVVIVGTLAMLISRGNLDVLNPAGIIASKERTLILITSFLSLFVVIPVFILLFSIAWKYREGNTKAVYTPDASGNRLLELLWWAIPTLIILILAVITVQSTHELDPYKTIASDVKPLTVQVVALQWKWLFIYPAQGVASINYLPIPDQTPINFEVTSDAAMNSFWIPSLGGQIYAMSGMSTQLHLEADGVGTYRGSSANISGAGFSGMNFKAQSMSRADFDAWVQSTTQAGVALGDNAYRELALPSQNNIPIGYKLMDGDLYNKIILKYMPADGTGMGM